jgi:hypothetical protein
MPERTLKIQATLRSVAGQKAHPALRFGYDGTTNRPCVYPLRCGIG